MRATPPTTSVGREFPKARFPIVESEYRVTERDKVWRIAGQAKAQVKNNVAQQIRAKTGASG